MENGNVVTFSPTLWTKLPQQAPRNKTILNNIFRSVLIISESFYMDTVKYQPTKQQQEQQQTQQTSTFIRNVL